MSISVSNLTKLYGTAKAVDSISFEVHSGEILGFLGPNGAGKTTTMRMITCYLSPSGGSVKVEGRVGHLESNLLHFTCSSLSEHLRTMDRYTTLAAEQLLATSERVTWSRLILEPPWTFFQTYIVKLGFLDGVEGLAIANMAALYNFLKYAKARFMSPGRR